MFYFSSFFLYSGWPVSDRKPLLYLYSEQLPVRSSCRLRCQWYTPRKKTLGLLFINHVFLTLYVYVSTARRYA